MRTVKNSAETARVVVIGAGFAGLAAASMLARRGLQVTLLEKNDSEGGRARSFATDGFAFDMGPSWYWMPDIFETYYQHFGKTASDFYDLRRLDPAFAIFFEQHDTLLVPGDSQHLFDVFENIEAGGAVKLRQFLEEAAYKYEVGMRDLVYKPGNSLLEFADLRLLKSLFRMHLFQSFHRYVRGYFKDSRLIKLMEFPVLFLGGMPENTPALYSLMNYAGLCLGTWYPMGGMHEIVKAMVTIANSAGVQLETGVAVERIVTGAGKVQGVQVNGDFYAADVVVAAADYHHVEQNLLPPADRSYDAAYWQTRVMAPSSLIFYLGVNKKLDNLQHHNLFFDADFEKHIREIYETPGWPENPLFYVCCPSQTDSSVAPPGCENIFILIPLAAGLCENDQLIEQTFDAVLSRLEARTGQAIRPHIVSKRAYSMRDFKYDYNAFKGNAYGLANTLRQTAIFKPALRSRKLRNLFFAGQLTVPGPGVPPSLISGQVAADQVLKYLA